MTVQSTTIGSPSFLRRRLWIISVLLLTSSCASSTSRRFAPLERQPHANLKVSPQGLESLRKLLEQGKTRAALVLFRGRVIGEWYWKDATPGTVFETWSVAKSFASACVGLLIDDGKIRGVDDPVFRYIPSWGTGLKARVTLRNILEQNSGLRERGNFVRQPDQVQAALSADVATTPGAVTRYNNAGCNVLSAVISAAAGKDPEVFMRERIWQPIGMTHTRWRRDAAGNVITYAGIETTARDLARFGQLFLNDGKWGRKRILSRQWIEESTRAQTRMRIANIQVGPYGYLWWVDSARTRAPHNYSALGFFGNNLTVIPDLDLVAVRLVGTDSEGLPFMFLTPLWVETLAGVVEKRSMQRLLSGAT